MSEFRLLGVDTTSGTKGQVTTADTAVIPINSYTSATPVLADQILITDADDSNNNKSVTLTALSTLVGGLAAVVDDTTPQLGGDLDMNGNQITSPDGTDQLDIPNGSINLLTNSLSRLDISDTGVRLGAANARVTTILDEDAMGSDSATALATQQSIKAYVDSQVATADTLAEVLANGNTTGANDIIVSTGQAIQTATSAGNTALFQAYDVDGASYTTFATLTANNTPTFSILPTSLQIAGTTAVTGILDEDAMGSDSATDLATQQSIKAYVDAQVATADTLAEVLANGNTTGANDIIISNGQAIQTTTTTANTALFQAYDVDGVSYTTFATLTSGNTPTFDLASATTVGGSETIVTASTTDTLTNKTFDANGTGNSLSNVETADIASGSKSGADTTLVTGTAGTNGNLLEWNGDGDAVDSGISSSGIEQPLSTTTGIDGKVVATTNLYTVPGGTTAVITKMVVRLTTATAIAGTIAFGAGVAAGEDDIFDSRSATGFDDTTKVHVFSAEATMETAQAAEVVKLGIDTAFTGTTATLAVDLFGYLI